MKNQSDRRENIVAERNARGLRTEDVVATLCDEDAKNSSEYSEGVDILKQHLI